MSPQIHFLLDCIKEINPLQASSVNSSLKDLDSEELELLNSYLKFCLSTGLDIPYIAKCYNVVVQDTLREQIYFKRHGSYRYSSYAEVASSVYFNNEYMEMYMYGLAITLFLWKNHRLVQRFFLKVLPKDKPGNYLEIGPGHGFNFMNAMRLTSFSYFKGIDLSPKSVELTQTILGSGFFGHFNHFQIACQDFLTEHDEKIYDAIVMGEVLEHVEKPEEFLSKIRELSCPESFIYITTCINAPAIDHIYLFHSVEHLEELIQATGLVIKDRLVVPYEGLTIEETELQKLPLNVALQLEKKGD
jgi:2-polyprenyl-3-methyl-5-hydroxy-6-metoxy-1,4-benzoquinol methylase